MVKFRGARGCTGVAITPKWYTAVILHPVDYPNYPSEAKGGDEGKLCAMKINLHLSPSLPLGARRKRQTSSTTFSWRVF